MSELIALRRPDGRVGDRHETHTGFTVEPYNLYGRHHEITEAEADVGVTRLLEGLHLDLRVRVIVRTTCDRTLEPTELQLEFGDSEFLASPNNRELSVQDWMLDLERYTERAVPNETPMQVFRPDTEPVELTRGGDEIDPRWRDLGGLFASSYIGF